MFGLALGGYLLSPSVALAKLYDDGQGDPFLNDVGKTIGSDRPELREDARDFRNVVGGVSTAVEEFLGVDTSRYVGYLDLFLGLFKRKKKEDSSGFGGNDGPPLDSSEHDESEDVGIDPSEVVGIAGVISPTRAKQLAKDAKFVGEGGGAFGLNRVVVSSGLGASELLKLEEAQLDMQLGEEGQALIAAKAEEATKAMEASNVVANEIQAVSASQDAFKLNAKQDALLAVLAQGQVVEQQQTRLAIYQGNRTGLKVQELLQKEAWSEEVNAAFNKMGSYRAATVFSSMYAIPKEKK